MPCSLDVFMGTMLGIMAQHRRKHPGFNCSLIGWVFTLFLHDNSKAGVTSDFDGKLTSDSKRRRRYREFGPWFVMSKDDSLEAMEKLVPLPLVDGKVPVSASSAARMSPVYDRSNAVSCTPSGIRAPNAPEVGDARS